MVININNFKINSNTTIIGFYYYLFIFYTLCIYTIRGKNNVVFFNHFNINNFTISLLSLFLLMSFILFVLVKTVIIKTNLVKSIDYLFSINNLLILLPYLFFVNNIFTFLFFLELISTILLYKLVSSKIWFKNYFKVSTLKNSIPQNYINMVFFQYWVTFFSTIFIVYFYINMFYLFGTGDWFVIQYLNTCELKNFTNHIFLNILLCIFILSIFFKLGVTPFHLFKIEVYKGVPLLSIFFYTTYYFIIFFVFLIYILSDFLISFSIQYYSIISILLLISSIYVVVLLFDVNFLKAFFTYSTVINTIGFLIIFISNF